MGGEGMEIQRDRIPQFSGSDTVSDGVEVTGQEAIR